MINLIVAMDKKGLIGKDNSLPWRIKEDMEYFRNTTLGHCIVMGRKTHESIPKELDRRANFILSQSGYIPKWGVRINSIGQFMGWHELYKFHGRETFVIGGAKIYEQFFPICDKLYITYVNNTYKGDTYFPIGFSQINDEFELESRVLGKECEFIVMRRKLNED